MGEKNKTDAGNSSKIGISIFIPTYNGGRVFSRCLEMIGQQDYEGQIQLIIVDSGSTDGTPELAERAGALVRRIDKNKFHHSNTRNEAVFLADFDNIVFTVQDAVPCSESWLSELEISLCETDVAAVYTDQIPHDDATPYARFDIESISRARGRERCPPSSNPTRRRSTSACSRPSNGGISRRWNSRTPGAPRSANLRDRAA